MVVTFICCHPRHKGGVQKPFGRPLCKDVPLILNAYQSTEEWQAFERSYLLRPYFLLKRSTRPSADANF